MNTPRSLHDAHVSAWIRHSARQLGAGAIAAGYEPHALHEYTDAQGCAEFWRLRLKHPATGEKWIRPMRRVGNVFELSEPDFPNGKPLYNLRELVVNPETPVVIVEGENKADALAKLGLLATTSGGAGSADSANWEPLAGRRVTVWPDNDDAGERYAQSVTHFLRGLKCAVSVVDVAALNLPKKGDAVDWLLANKSANAADIFNLPVVEVSTSSARHAADAADKNFSWPDPKPIAATLYPVPPFDAEALLPDALREWIMDEADRMPCPPDFIAAAAIVALGSIIGARCAIKPKARDSWLIVPNLWGGIVGLPSAKKSPAISTALNPLDRLIARAIEAHQADSESNEADKTIFEAQKDAIEARIKATAKNPKKSDLGDLAKELQTHCQKAPKPPKLRRYKSNDTTVEKLGELLRENPSGLLVLRDELVGLLASWDREGREGERAFYLESWNGNASFDTDRIGRGTILIPNLCVSIFGGIQPDKLTGYLEQAANALANDGMLQRFQVLVYPDHIDWEYRDRLPNKSARTRAYAVFEALAEFDPMAWSAEPADDFTKFPHFRFDNDAQKIFVAWSADLHRIRLRAEEHPLIAQHLAKFDKLFPALALILHLVESADTRNYGPVTAQSALRAAAWCDYLEAHARRAYGLLKDDGLRAAQALAQKLQRDNLADGFTARDVRRNQWRSLTTDESVQAALDWLADEAWLRAEEVGGKGPGGGRRTYRYRMNPKVKKVSSASDEPACA